MLHILQPPGWRLFYIVGFKSQKVRRRFRGKRYERGLVDKFVVFVATSRNLEERVYVDWRAIVGGGWSGIIKTGKSKSKIDCVEEETGETGDGEAGDITGRREVKDKDRKGFCHFEQEGR